MNQKRAEFCGGCDIKLAKQEFENQTIEDLNADAPAWERYGFDRLYETVVGVRNLRELPLEKRTLITDRLIRILEAEQARADRVKAWNMKQAAEAAAARAAAGH